MLLVLLTLIGCVVLAEEPQAVGEGYQPPVRPILTRERPRPRLIPSNQRVRGAEYIGRGYNLLYGNPDVVELGTRPTSEATDPGIDVKHILDITWQLGTRYLQVG